MFNIGGNQGNVACTAAGTNAITLTPNTNFFLPTSYTNFQMVTFAAAATSTGAVTIQIGAIGFVKLFNPNGVQSNANDLTIGTLYTACFQSTLDTGAGGFQILNQPGAGTTSVPFPQGYLTTVSQTPIITTDSTSITSIFYTPYVGQLCPIFNGTNFVGSVFSELTLALAAASQLASNIYDVFIFLNSGVVTAGFGPTWTAGGGSITAGSCARGSGAGSTQLSRVNGFLTNAVSMTVNNGASTFSVGINRGTYVGSVWVDTVAGQVTCHRLFGQNRKFGVWNAYNRVPIVLQATDSTVSWNYTINTLRASNGNAANNVSCFVGLAEELFNVMFYQRYQAAVATQTTASGLVTCGVGVNSTTVATGFSPSTNFVSFTLAGGGTLTQTANAIAIAGFTQAPLLGINTYQSLEQANVTNSTTSFQGTSANMLLSGAYRG